MGLVKFLFYYLTLLDVNAVHIGAGLDPTLKGLSSEI
jgi:hypothetical protein